MQLRLETNAKIAKGESTDKTGKTVSYLLGFAEPNPILCKDTER